MLSRTEQLAASYALTRYHRRPMRTFIKNLDPSDANRLLQIIQGSRKMFDQMREMGLDMEPPAGWDESERLLLDHIKSWRRPYGTRAHKRRRPTGA